MPQPNALLTVQEFFEYLKEPVPGSSDPNYIVVEQLIDRASDYCERSINGPIVNATIQERVDGDNSDELLLSFLPIVSLTTVLEDGNDITSSLDFYDSGSIYYANDGVFQRGKQRYDVTYVAGYGASNTVIPFDLKQAALLIVQYWYKRDVLDYSTTFGESEIIVDNRGFPLEANQLLDPYRKPRMGSIEGQRRFRSLCNGWTDWNSGTWGRWW